MMTMVALAVPPAPAMAAIDPFALIVLLFIALPILQGVFGKKQKEEQRRRQEQRRRAQQGRSTGADDGPQARERRPERAADMVPDDLWELLTGERRQGRRDSVPTREWGEPAQNVPTSSAPVATEPEAEWQAIPEPAPYEPLSERDEESGRPWRVSDERPAPPPPPLPERSDNLPEAVSLEQPVTYDDAQERAFHEELAHLPPAARAHYRRRLPYGLGHEDEVRRAFILTEILGPPKGLR
ncbi:MAG: hypothetical protein P8099_13195 [Gemmatimonadota bacterium]